MNDSKSAYISKNNSALQYDAASTSKRFFYKEIDASVMTAFIFLYGINAKAKKMQMVFMTLVKLFIPLTALLFTN